MVVWALAFVVLFSARVLAEPLISWEVVDAAGSKYGGLTAISLDGQVVVGGVADQASHHSMLAPIQVPTPSAWSFILLFGSCAVLRRGNRHFAR